MTLLQLRNQTLQRLAESTSDPKWFTADMVDAAINEGQMLYVLLTLCLEKSATFTVTGGNNFVQPVAQAEDWFLPLRVRISGGAKVLPGTVGDFHAEERSWPAERDIIRKYAAMGCNLLAFYPVPAIDTAVTITYAYSPARLEDDADEPEIPAEDHPALSDYALWRCELKAGGADLANANSRLQSFLELAVKRGTQVRARNMGQGYDRLPSELTKADISRIIKEANSGPAGSRQRRGNPVAALQ